MPRFDIGTQTLKLPPGVLAAFARLDRLIEEALSRVGHDRGIFCGRLLGTPISHLYDALSTDVVETANTAGYRPLLAIDGANGRFFLPIPAERIQAHEQVMLLSYLLRAHVYRDLTPLVADENLRNTLVRDYVDGWMFGDYLRFMNILSYFGSLEQLHAEHDVPMGMVLGYAAKFNLRTTSIISLYGLNVDGVQVNSDSEYLMVGKARVGRARALTGYLGWLQCSGHIDVSADHSQHVSLEDGLGKQIVAISSNVGSFHNAETGDKLGSVTRTILWSSRSRSRVFSFPDGNPVGSTEQFIF